MNKVEILKIIAGILILMFSATILMMVFSDNGLKALIVLFNFKFYIGTSNLAEAIASAALSATALGFFIIGMLAIGVLYLIVSVNFGILTLVLRESKTITIIVLLFTALFLFMEIRALIVLAVAELTSGILIAHLFADLVIAGICIYSLIILIGFPDQLKPIAEKV